MIKALVLDCFGVLYVPKNDYIYQSILANPTVHHDEIRDLARQNDYGFIDDTTLFQGIAQLTGRSFDEVKESLVSGFVRNQEFVDYLQSLRPRYKLALLSNLGHNSMIKFFTQEERARLFDAVVISGDVGMIKPNPEIFEYTCRQLEVEPHEAVLIDDSEANCEGARSAGMQAVRHQSFWHTRQELDELLR